MNRRRTATATATVTCFALAAGALVACGGGNAAVPLRDLAAQHESYDERTVVTEGVVVAIEDRPGAEPYFVLEDDAANRVRLLPDSAARAHVGESVAVTGVFRFNPAAGRELHIDTIESR